jgi:hypothetical protein
MSVLEHRAGRRTPVNGVIGGEWWDACRRADAKRATERQRESAAVQRARRLIDDSTSLERAWAEVNDPQNRPTPQVTIEAVMYLVRERGVATLTEPGNKERLKTCDAAAKQQIRGRIARLTRERGEP